jgi:hypothetical protein
MASDADIDVLVTSQYSPCPYSTSGYTIQYTANNEIYENLKPRNWDIYLRLKNLAIP